MLLRYVVLRGRMPETDQEWQEYGDWKRQQLALAECHMAETSGDSTDICEGCPGRPDCPKANRRKTLDERSSVR